MSRIHWRTGAVAALGMAIAGCSGSTGHPAVNTGLATPPVTPIQASRTSPALSPHQQLLHDYPKRCGARFDRWNLLQADSASESGGVLAVVGHPGYMRCGGPSDVVYLHHRRVETLTLAPGAVVQVVDIEPPGSPTRAIDPAKLRPYLRRHHWSNFFRYVGPADAITKLIELYHP